MCYQQDKTLKGYGADVTKLIIDELGLNQAIELVSWKEAFHRLQGNKPVMHFPLSRTAERDKQFLWAGPIVTVDLSLFVLSHQSIQWPSSQELFAGFVIGFVTCEDLQELGFDEKHIRIYPSERIAYHRFARGEYDVLLSSKAALQARLNLYQLALSAKPIYTLPKKQAYYFAFSKNTDVALIKHVQDIVDNLFLKGKLQALQSQYFDLDNATPQTLCKKRLNVLNTLPAQPIQS